MSRVGYFLLFRQFLDNPLLDDKPYCKGFAWVTLLAMTNSKKEMMKVKNGALIPVERGECGMSEYALADKFGWSRGKVRRWLKELEKNYMILQKKVENHSVIKVLNYDKFQNGTTKKQATVLQNNPDFIGISDQFFEQNGHQTVLQKIAKMVLQNNPDFIDISDQFFKQNSTTKKQKNGHNKLNSNTSYINISLSIEEREKIKKYLLVKKKNIQDPDAYIRKLLDNGDITIIKDRALKWYEKQQAKENNQIPTIEPEPQESEEDIKKAIEAAHKKMEEAKKR